MNEEEKLKKEKSIRLGQLCEEWLDKVGNDLFEKEKQEIISNLDKAMPNELIAVQARYRAIQSLMARINSIVNEKKRVVRNMRNENRRDNRGGNV